MTPNPSSTALAQPRLAKLGTRTETRSCTWRLPTATRVSGPPPIFSPFPPEDRTPIRARPPPLELLDYLLPLCPPSLLSAQNHAGSTALHWAALNAHIAAARALVEYPDGPGVSLIDVKNAAGRSPLGEAEAAGWDEGAKWMVEVMRLDDNGNDDGAAGRDDVGDSRAEVGEEPADMVIDHDQDADGRVALAPPIAVEEPSVDGSSPQL